MVKNFDTAKEVLPGKLVQKNSPYVIAMIENATQACLNKDFQGMVTGPVHKNIINQSGINFSGHTEFIANICKSNSVMAFVSDNMKMALATTHIALKEVPEAIDSGLLIETIEIIEININNLAAVPSVVFGILGLAIFINIFGLPRSIPLIGGMVLALMTLPTIIISSRAAIRAVPPSIRDGALGIGASKMQTTFHHVLPLALPGMLTGTIIGMAQALGETAPLLMIGMVAFIVDIPGSITDPGTVLPVQIFMWADFAERMFIQKTSSAIMVLLAFLVVMNSFAVWLRKKLERRW